MSDIPAIEKAKSETIRILLVEDDDGCALVMQNILERWRYRAFNVRRAENLSAALRQVAQGEIDLVLLDLGLPDSQGLDTFGRMHAAAANVPIVVLTGLDDEELAATTVQQGAQDYLVKGPVDGASLARAIRYAIERCRAQQALRESEERYRTLFDQASDGIAVMRVDGKGLVVNESFARMHGYSPQEMENLHLQDLDTPETSQLAPERLRRLMAGEKLSFEVEHYHKDGRSFPLSVSASLVRLQGQLCFLGFHRDITEHKRAEHELMESKALVDAVVENVPLMIFLKEATDLRFVIFNRAGEDLLGYDRKTLLGKNNLDLFPPEQAAHFMAKDREVLGGETLMLDIPEEPILTAKQGTRLLHTRKVCIRGADGKTKYLLGISEDITERKQAEEALRESESRYRTLFEDAQDGMALADAETGRLADCNQALCRMVEWEKAELVGQPQTILHPTEDRTEGISRTFRQHRAEDPGRALEDRLLSRGGRLIPVEIRAARIRIGARDFLLGIFRDITERKQAEQKLKDHQEHLEELVGVRTADLKHANERLEGHDKARSEFISNVSHELKTPLAALNFGLDNMLQGVVGPVPAPCRSYLDMMRHSCQRLQKTVGDVLDMASIDANTLRLNRVRVPLSILVRKIVESMQTQMDAKSLQVALSLPKRAGFVECDRHRIERVVVNVLGNAIKFTPEGGEIRIALRSAPATPGFLVLDIADNGVGIPAEHLPHVTKRYYRGAHRVDGAGLGLSISSEILTLHGGAIVLTSPPPGKDKGTLVSIRLPAVEPPTVFVVGGAEVCHPISAQFLAHGYRVQVFRDDSEAVAAMRRETPYVAILDFSMASLETAGTIAQIRGAPDLQCVPLIALTEADIPETKRQILAGFAIPALKKPWHENDLFACLEQTVLGSRREGAE